MWLSSGARGGSKAPRAWLYFAATGAQICRCFQIYTALSEKLRAITKQDIFYCYIVIAYFIQSCEVFDAFTK